ncbi:MAG: serine/threonine-protein kinase, partial [Chloroflexota bacterium]
MSEIINGRYVLKREIGSGGMGVVSEALDRLTGNTVAFKRVRLNEESKVLTTTHFDYELKDLRLVLAREFQIMAGLRHPNIVSVLDYGFDGEKQPFYTMTLLAKSKTILQAGAILDLDGKIGLIEQLLQGLVYLHRHGILHRDIKPENVLVSNGVVRLLDFGLSHKSEDESTFGGSPQYIAPEVLNLREITRAADLYSVGVLLYQLLVGQHPFGKMDLNFYERLLTQDPDWTLVGPEWRPILQALFAKSPNERPASASDVLDTLAREMGRSLPKETPAIRESYLQAATFVGREREMERLNRALVEGWAGKGGVYLIGGESGVGKSRLLDEVRTQALVRGWQVFTGQAISEVGPPFQLWQEIISRLALNQTLTDLEASVLCGVVPHMGQLIGREVSTAPRLEGKA